MTSGGELLGVLPRFLIDASAGICAVGFEHRPEGSKVLQVRERC